MSYKLFFKIVFYQLILSGFLSIFSTGKLDPASGIIYLLLVGTAFFRGEKIAEKHSGFKPFTIFLLFIFFIFFFLLDFLFLTGEFALSIVHMAMGVSLIKLFTLKTTRDYFYLFFIAFGFLLVSTTFTVDMIFLLFASWFLVSGILALMLNDIRISSLRFSKSEETKEPLQDRKVSIFKEPAGPGRTPLPSMKFVGMALGIYFVILFFTFPTFFILPRLAFGLWQLNLSNRQELSGFSETTTLGDISSIKLNDMTVMYIKTNIDPDQLPASLRWRGIALDHFDGRNWSLEQDVTYAFLRPSGNWYTINERRLPEILLYQEIYVEPISSKVLFLAGRQLGMSRNIGKVSRTRTDTLIKPFPHFRKLKYFGYSDVYHFPESELEQAPPVYPETISPIFWEISNPSEKVAALVESVVSTTSSPYKKAVALREFLKNNFDYSLEMSECPEDQDPIEFFLFQMKQGHCEYFSSALAIMLRYAGIPSRLVNGFQRGEVNRFTNTFVIRQSDAHSWVEAYFEGFGWVELDATPPPPPRDSFGVSFFMEQLLESIHFFWMSNVVNFDMSDQFRLFNSMRNSAASWRVGLKRAYQNLRDRFTETVRRWSRSLFETGTQQGGNLFTIFIVACLILLACGTGFYLYRKQTGRRGSNGRKGRRNLISLNYKRFLKTAAKSGFLKSESETPEEFSRRLKEAFSPTLLEEFVGLYYRLRFSGRNLEENSVDRLNMLLRRLEESRN